MRRDPCRRRCREPLGCDPKPFLGATIELLKGCVEQVEEGQQISLRGHRWNDPEGRVEESLLNTWPLRRDRWAFPAEGS